MILLTTNDSLRFKVSAAETTNPIDFVCSYVDLTGFTPSSLTGTSNSINYVTLAAAPSSGVRQIKFLSIFNDDTTTKTITQIITPTTIPNEIKS